MRKKCYRCHYNVSRVPSPRGDREGKEPFQKKPEASWLSSILHWKRQMSKLCGASGENARVLRPELFFLRAREDSAPASRLRGKTSLSAAQENLRPFKHRGS